MTRAALLVIAVLIVSCENTPKNCGETLQDQASYHRMKAEAYYAEADKIIEDLDSPHGISNLLDKNEKIRMGNWHMDECLRIKEIILNGHE